MDCRLHNALFYCAFLLVSLVAERSSNQHSFWNPKISILRYGVGTQIIYVDPENDLVIFARWIEQDKVAEFLKIVLASIKKQC